MLREYSLSVLKNVRRGQKLFRKSVAPPNLPLFSCVPVKLSGFVPSLQTTSFIFAILIGISHFFVDSFIEEMQLLEEKYP